MEIQFTKTDKPGTRCLAENEKAQPGSELGDILVAFSQVTHDLFRKLAEPTPLVKGEQK